MHFSRGPMKYTRKWEDESAYTKQSSTQNRNPRPEDFPELGSKGERRPRNIHHDREEKENRSRQNQQIEDDNRIYAKVRRNPNRQQMERVDRGRRQINYNSGVFLNFIRKC